MAVPCNPIHYLSTLIFLISISLSKIPQLANSEPPTSEKTALQSFINQVPHSSRYNWNSSTSPCDWTGVTCDIGRSFVVTLRLPGAGLLGTIPSGTIGQLTRLRILSIHHNSLSGPLPSDLSNLTYLRSAYLNNNQFSGGFPSSITALSRLSRLDLSTNQFTGPVPFSINNLRQLSRLYLQTNNFTGSLPSITLPLTDFNVSHNQLNGTIPKTLSKFPQSSFTGNLQLCGSPLSACNSSFFPSPPSSPPSTTTVPSSPAEQHSHKKKLSTAAIIAISVSAAILLLILLICLLLCCLRRRRNDPSKVPKSSTTATATTRAVGSAPGEAGTSSSKDDLTSGGGVEGERNKLVFINRGVSGAGGGYSFDLEDLLRASAEVLGKGSVGTSYKAVLEEGTTVVVKRLKDVVASKREFEMQMESLGGTACRHENVVPIRAYYFSKDEKLLVCDYYPAGSLSALLHGSRGSGRTAIDWESRMKVAICAARGLTHLHTTGKVVHGNIKSSNVLLHQGHQEAALNDFGLNPLFGSATPPNRVAGYRAPEVFETRKVTFKSDVYSFGVLLLELLTGKAPNQASLGDEGIDLPRWVQSVVREEWTAEVFDVELMRYNNIEEEMVQLLQLAMSCVQTVPDQRPTMPDVLRMMEEIPRGSGDTDEGLLRQSSDDPSKGSDGHTPPMSSVTP